MVLAVMELFVMPLYEDGDGYGASIDNELIVMPVSMWNWL